MTPENLIPPISVMLLAFECPPDILINRSRPPVHEATGGYGFPHAIPTRVPHKTLLFFGGDIIKEGFAQKRTEPSSYFPIPSEGLFLLAVSLIEFVYASCSIHKFHLSGIERM